MTRDIDDRISSHYGWSGLMDTIEREIHGKGIDPQQVTVEQLAPVDNYHWHRVAGALALARAAEITGADRVIDVGGGIGGPARQLAHRFGCHVTVLDLTSEYCAVGAQLTDWTGLTDREQFVCANALDMPFPDHRRWASQVASRIRSRPSRIRSRPNAKAPGLSGFPGSRCWWMCSTTWG
jgi:SAM-dependent methyltransferase